MILLSAVVMGVCQYISCINTKNTSNNHARMTQAVHTNKNISRMKIFHKYLELLLSQLPFPCMGFHNVRLQSLRDSELHCALITSKIVPLDPMSSLHVPSHIVPASILLIAAVPHTSEFHSLMDYDMLFQALFVLWSIFTMVARVVAWAILLSGFHGHQVNKVFICSCQVVVSFFGGSFDCNVFQGISQCFFWIFQEWFCDY